VCCSLDSGARTSLSDAPRAARLGLLALTFFRESQYKVCAKGVHHS